MIGSPRSVVSRKYLYVIMERFAVAETGTGFR
jgi:hypothetical protein